jgi:hypothetical protein
VATRLDAPPPNSAELTRGGGGRGWVELVRATDDIEAHLLSGRLEEAGVETHTVKDRSAPGAWLYGGSNPWAPVVVLVRRLQLEEARLVLAEISFSGPAAERAPEDDASKGRWATRALVWWVAAIILGLIFTTIALVRTAELIRSCDVRLLCSEEGSR